MEVKAFTSQDSNFSISGSVVKGYYSMPSKHFHDKYEIYYLKSGERYYFIKDRVFHIGKGHLVLVNEGELHKTADAEKPDHERVLIYFRKAFINTVNGSISGLLDLLSCKNYCMIGLSLKEQQEMEKIFSEMSREADFQASGFEICLQGLLMKLLVYIARYVQETDESAFISGSPKHEKVSEIVKYINENYHEDLSIPGISKLFYISPYYLSRIFRETTGFTLLEYINLVRVKAAQKLLADKKVKVIEIAENSGFGSVSQFNRTFRKIAGASPLNYRKQVKKNN